MNETNNAMNIPQISISENGKKIKIKRVCGCVKECQIKSGKGGNWGDTPSNKIFALRVASSFCPACLDGLKKVPAKIWHSV